MTDVSSLHGASPQTIVSYSTSGHSQKTIMLDRTGCLRRCYIRESNVHYCPTIYHDLFKGERIYKPIHSQVLLLPKVVTVLHSERWISIFPVSAHFFIMYFSVRIKVAKVTVA